MENRKVNLELDLDSALALIHTIQLKVETVEKYEEKNYEKHYIKGVVDTYHKLVFNIEAQINKQIYKEDVIHFENDKGETEHQFEYMIGETPVTSKVRSSFFDNFEMEKELQKLQDNG